MWLFINVPGAYHTFLSDCLNAMTGLHQLQASLQSRRSCSSPGTRPDSAHVLSSCGSACIVRGTFICVKAAARLYAMDVHGGTEPFRDGRLAVLSSSGVFSPITGMLIGVFVPHAYVMLFADMVNVQPPFGAGDGGALMGRSRRRGCFPAPRCCDRQASVSPV